ncbi:Rieske (2Fe-2S) protein [Agromyces italicus]|uniref:Rieske (2Fe-2S) protein n=1 Tax=Agromyces italicus TaxID=279572 RepID=UPI0003F8B607|nr:Rieske (2Fe-2S) protein [Agromyces italicus]
MTEPSDLTRRAVLTIGSVGAVGSALTLAACAADDSGGSASPSIDPPSDEDPTATTGPEPDAPALGDDVGALADVPVGGSIDATIDGEPALIAQPTSGQVVAFSAICTHQQCVVAAAGEEFHCPCHGSIYEAATGEVVQGPAIDPLTPIPVAVSGDRIVTAS